MGPTVANRRASWEPNPYCKVSAGSVTTLQNGGSITTTRGSRHPTRHSDAKDTRASPVLGRSRRTNGTRTCQRHARNTQLSRRKRILGHSTNVWWQRSSVILNLDRLHLLRAVVLLLSRDSLLVLSQRRPSQRQTPIATPMVSTREGPSSLTRSEASLIHRLKNSGSSKTPTPLVVCGTLRGPSAEYPRLVRPAERSSVSLKPCFWLTCHTWQCWTLWARITVPVSQLRWWSKHDTSVLLPSDSLTILRTPRIGRTYDRISLRITFVRLRILRWRSVIGSGLGVHLA